MAFAEKKPVDEYFRYDHLFYLFRGESSCIILLSHYCGVPADSHLFVDRTDIIDFV